jgi:hypothetical protein
MIEPVGPLNEASRAEVKFGGMEIPGRRIYPVSCFKLARETQ